MLVSLPSLSNIAGNSWSPATVQTDRRFIWSSSEVNKIINRTDPMIMEKKQLYSIVTSLLAKYGFKHWKQSVWMRLGSEVSDCIYLQRSLYGHFYYFHYGYIINKLPLPPGVFWHTFGKIDIPISIYKKIQFNLDLENNLSDEERERELKHNLQLVVPERNSIDTEKELKVFLLSEQLLLSKDVMDYLKIKNINGKYVDAKE